MANAVDKLFDSVLEKLSPEPEHKSYDWPDFDGRDDETDISPHGELQNSEDDGVYSIDQENVGQRVRDLISEGGVQVELPVEEREAVEGGIRHRGFEAIAFYKSKRFINQRPYIGRWGIFYLKQGLTHVEYEIAKTYPGYGSPAKFAHDFLREHEHFHFRSDVQTLMFEATLGKHLYVPLRRALRGRSSHFVEEALANRQVLDWSKKGVVGLSDFAFDFMKLQPNAYARFDEPRLQLAAEWAANVVNGNPPGCPGRHDLSHWVEATPPGLMRRSLCPEYVVYPTRLSSWCPPALVLPPVSRIDDGADVVKVLSSRFIHLRAQWDKTKEKLLENRLLRGLNFKPWPKDGRDVYSVRVDDNFRAHLKHQGNGSWNAYVLGPHKALGHG